MSFRDLGHPTLRGIASCALLLLVAAAPAVAVGGLDGPNQPLGLVSGMPYTGGEYGGVDAVSPYSGSLTLAIPVGQAFRVGNVAYGFSLVWGSNVWSYTEGTDQAQPGGFVKAELNTSFNAGLGWVLSLGRLLKPNQLPNTTGDWIYFGPDGSSHKFFKTLHVGETDQSGNPWYTRYTRDGSMLRLRATNTSSPYVEFPDGTVYVFNADGRPTQMRDRFKDAGGNYLNTVTIAYPNSTTWRISDSLGRTHYVRFDANYATTGKVTEIELQAFGSTAGVRQTATYSLVYDAASIRRTCQDTWWGNNVLPGNGGSEEANLNVQLLRKVTGPTEIDASQRVIWNMTDPGTSDAAYHGGANRANEQCNFAGVIERLELPTHGVTTWDWQLWHFPQTGKAYVDASPGVWHRTIVNDQSIDWNYATWLYTSGAANAEVTTNVRDPENNVTRFHFYAPANATLPWDYSLPISIAAGADSGGRYLSQEVISAAGPTLRQVWLKFTHDDLTGMGGNDKILSNRRVVSSRTVFLDDASHFAQTDFSDFDGLGHYRLATSSGDFPLGTNSRTDRTQWNPTNGCYSECPGTPNFTPVAVTSPWLLGTFTYTQQSDASDTATQEYSFNATTGWLDQRRVLVNATTEASDDVLVQYCADTSGNLVSERYYGGFTNQLPGKTIGCGTSSDSTYRIDYEYQSGVRSKATFKTPAGASLGFDNWSIPAGGVDFTTGLVTKSCDSAGYCSEATYDALGRLLSQSASTSAGAQRAATVNYAYSYVVGPWQGWQIATTLACPSGLTCTPEEVAGYPASITHYDGFGRPFKVDRQNADLTWSKQYTKYTELGRVEASSEWTAGLTGSGTEPATVYSNFDAFGRARTVTAPDGHVTTLAYTGSRVVATTVQIAAGAFPPSGPPPESPFTREQHFDRFGRLVRVVEPSGVNGAAVNTDYSYDLAGHLVQSNQIGQVRSYVFDRRGFLKSETIPEYGASGNGTFYHCSFDALGNPWKGQETACGQPTTLGVTMALDYAGRLTSVTETGGNLLEQFVYDAATGRLSVAKSFNYLPEIGATTFEVDETYAYSGIGGSVSTRTTDVYVNAIPQERFVVGATLFRSGQLASLVYPTCTGGGCGSPGQGGRTVSFQYAKGFLSKVPGFVDQPVTYWANGMFQDVRHSNGMRVRQEIDPATMMQRVSQLNMYDVDNAAIFLSGAYAFDGAGNIKAMGTAFNYRYDGVSRLVESRETWGATTYQQSPTFDAWGNIQALQTGAMPNAPTVMLPTSSASNRLTTAGTTYDPAGNMTSWNGGSTLAYDRLNRMRRFTSGTEDWVFAYATGGERLVSIRVNGGGKIWTVRGLDGQVLREWRADIGVHSFKDHVWTGRDLLAEVQRTPNGGSWTETTLHAGTDHLSSVRKLTDSTGHVVANHIYYPFGKELTTSQDTERIKWAGYERDLWNTTSAADDLDYLHARSYNPQIGRFLQIDPLAGSIGAPQTLNRYSYSIGNPVLFTDPSGLAISMGFPLGLCYWGCICDQQGNVIYCPGDQSEVVGKAPVLPEEPIDIDKVSQTTCPWGAVNGVCRAVPIGNGGTTTEAGSGGDRGGNRGGGDGDVSEKNDCTGGKGITILHGVGVSAVPIIGVDVSVGMSVSFQTGFPWIETGLFVSGGDAHGYGGGADVFVALYRGAAPSLRGSTKNLNGGPPFVPGGFTYMLDPGSNRPRGLLVGVGPSFPYGTVSMVDAKTRSRSSGDAYREWKKANGECP